MSKLLKFIIFLLGIDSIIFSALSLAEIPNHEEFYQKSGGSSWGNLYKQIFGDDTFGKSYALVIGVGNYQPGWNPLEAPPTDAERVRNFLIDDAGFDYVVTLINEKATQKSIEKLMEETFPNLIGERDRFLFYFSGHGTQRTKGGRIHGYLALQNAGPQAWADMISMDEVQKWDNLISEARQAIFILDSCFSGIAGIQSKTPLMDKKIERLSQYGHHLITAGTAQEESISSLKEWNGSLFTDAFLKGGAGQADSESADYPVDGVVSLKELMKYVEDRIDAETSRYKRGFTGGKMPKMSPQLSELQNNKGEFFFIVSNSEKSNARPKEDSNLPPGTILSKGKDSTQPLEPPPSDKSKPALKNEALQERAKVARQRSEEAIQRIDSALAQMRNIPESVVNNLGFGEERKSLEVGRKQLEDPPGYQPGSDPVFEEKRAAQVEAYASKLESFSDRLMGKMLH